jgi:hypothetical protein
MLSIEPTNLFDGLSDDTLRLSIRVVVRRIPSVHTLFPSGFEQRKCLRRNMLGDTTRLE